MSFYVAGPNFRGGKGDKRKEGDPVPEAADYKNLRAWISAGHIVEVPEISPMLAPIDTGPEPVRHRPGSFTDGHQRQPIETSAATIAISMVQGDDDGGPVTGPRQSSGHQRQPAETDSLSPPAAAPKPDGEGEETLPKKPSLEELEAILNSEEEPEVEILPNGEVRAVGKKKTFVELAKEARKVTMPSDVQPAPETKRKAAKKKGRKTLGKDPATRVKRSYTKSSKASRIKIGE